MRTEEYKIDEIIDEDRNYDGEDNNLQRNIRENYGTGVEQLKPSMEGKA